ncbi:agmatine deiminase [Tropicimonas sp. IMCC6043]|uniref:agmatine deiminase n=1 Tax=Tropicimonas sp. IMCC6043 TaxID=2510645 RepID=UPI00101BD55A|nr:agmatine deiminase [Tropicimonas sp. IMCC6043]RYH10914.1 agmatine deiminase [Tropicimonas sp. IMCC6043]
MSRILDTTPAADGFAMPGEHAPQEEVWMAWPERSDNWRLGAKPAQDAFAAVAGAIAEVTPVSMAVSAAQWDNARARLPATVRVVEMSTDDAWMRDIGPTFVTDAKDRRRGVDWEFNAWGGLLDGLYFPWNRDARVASKICVLHRADIYRPGLVMEGGAIHTDGAGTLFTTEECLLHPSRNPDLAKSEIEAALKAALGQQKVIWLPRGLDGDETNGHVDNLMHVARPGEVILSWCDDPADPNHAICREALAVLEAAQDAAGRTLTIRKLHIPAPLHITGEEAGGIDPTGDMARAAGTRLAASYVNFLVTNGRVIFPLLDPDRDAAARAELQSAFPEREIVGLPAREILLGGGNIHCITQQVPAI